jgi:Transposase DDE domain group 1
MKLSRSEVRKKAHAIPTLRFENQTLTSFSGLVVFQALFAKLRLKARLAECFRCLGNEKVFDRATLFLQLVVHFLLGYRELRHACHYQDDPLVKRVLGLNRMPDVSTLSRMLGEATAHTVENLRLLLRGTVLDRLRSLALPRITMDFDGSVLSTSRHAEGTAVGFNKKKKGARSYYPLFCTIPQLGQVFDVLHRPGNVHDSNGAKAFILQCIERVRQVAPYAIIEVRFDSAFFSDEIVSALDGLGVEFTISVPFERFPKLKGLVERRRYWWRLDGETSYFETKWKPESWPHQYRFLVIRTLAKKQQKGPVQLDLFVPHEYGYEFKVIVTNKTVRCRSVVRYHEGRGAQENVFAELKSHCHLGYVPVRTLCGNQTYLLAGLLAYNLTRELQMQTTEPVRGTTSNRAALWAFEKVDTLRKTVLQRAGRLSRPGGTLTLTIAGGRWLKERISQLLAALPAPS